MNYQENIDKLVKEIADRFSDQCQIVTVESCTSGLLASSLTSIAGSSKFYERGFVTYSNDAKIESVSVNRNTLDSFGAVSIEVAEEMAKGALQNSKGDIAISTTGIAGPDGGTSTKPVGLVCFAIATRQLTYSQQVIFTGGRNEIRSQSVIHALNMVLALQ